MTFSWNRVIYWAPRALSIAFIAFLSLFSLDVFQEGAGLWTTLAALFVHLIPVFVLIGALALAWRWEWIGAALYAGAGALYIFWVATKPLPPYVKLSWILTIAAPALLIAALFLASWFNRAGMRPAR